jgi:hypothetical protein
MSLHSVDGNQQSLNFNIELRDTLIKIFKNKVLIDINYDNQTIKLFLYSK